jgi:hypothetical protein
VSLPIGADRQYSHSQRKKAAKTVKKTEFEHKFLKICRQNKKRYPLETELDYFYSKYKNTYNLISNKQMAVEMAGFARFSRKKKLKYRMQLAEEGIELTPDQVDFYIFMLMIILKDKYDIDT